MPEGEQPDPPPEAPAPPPQAFNPLHEWLIRDKTTDKMYQPVGLRIPETGEYYWLRVVGDDGVLDFAPNYIHNLVWMRKTPAVKPEPPA